VVKLFYTVYKVAIFMRKLLAISFLLVSNLLWAEGSNSDSLSPLVLNNGLEVKLDPPERYRVMEISNDSLTDFRFFNSHNLDGKISVIEKPELVLETHLVLRKKVNSEQYAFYASKPNVEALVQLYRFKISVTENILMSKFYGKKRGSSYDDAVDIYFSKDALYSSKYSTLFYFSGKKMVRLDASRDYPSAFTISGSPEGTEVLTEAGSLLGTYPFSSSFENVGLKLIKVKREGYMPKLIPVALIESKMTEINVDLAVEEAVEPSVIEKVDFVISDSNLNSIRHLDSLLNSVEVIMEINESLLQVMRDKFLKRYYPVEEMSASARMYQEAWQAYNEKYKNFREAAFLKHATLAIDKQIHNEEFRARLLDNLSLLEKEDKNTVVEKNPTWWRRDSLGSFQVRTRLEGLSGELDALWMGSFDLDSAGQFWFVEQVESDSSLVKFKVQYQNKPIRFINAGKIERKYYRLKKIFLEYEGRWLEGEGKFDFASEVENHPKAIAWFRADSIKAAEIALRIEKEEREGALRKIVEKERLYRSLLTEARGDLVDLPGGIFVFDGDKVELSPFSIQKYELTNELYSRVVGLELSEDKSAEEPKVNINWSSARSVCKQMGGELPTEAQWEFAARSGSTTYFYWGDRSSDPQPFAVYEKAGLEKAQVVGSRESNSFGLYDMAGNVSEWVYDAEGFFNFLSFVSKQNPNGMSHWLAGDRRIKGGNFLSSKVDLRHTSFDFEDPRYFANNLGFRCVFNDHPTLEELQLQVELYQKKKIKNLKED
jgi:hypothetical protein